MADAAQQQQHCTRAWYMRPPVWLLAIVLTGLAIFGVMKMASGPAAISYSNFLVQLDGGNIASVTFAGTEIDGTFKHPPESMTANSAAMQTRFRSYVPTFGDPTLLPELRQQHVAIDVVSSSSWISWLGRLPWPMVLIIGGVLVAGLVKLTRGDKSSSAGAPLPTHPIMGLISGLFGKKGQEASHPRGNDVTRAPPGTS